MSEYLVDLNATAAAGRAGYKVPDIGRQLITKNNVSEAIQEAMAAREKRTGITSDRVLQELAKLGFANMADYMKCTPGGDPYLDFSQLTRDQAAALVEVTVEDFIDGRGEDSRSVRRVKFKLADKRAALVDIGKHLNMFVERKEITGKDGGPIQTKTEATFIDPIQAAQAYQDFIAGK